MSAEAPVSHRSGLSRRLAHALLVLVGSRLPRTDFPVLGRLACRLRRHACRTLFDECGDDVNIESGVRVGRSTPVRIGHRSGLGVNLDIGRPLVVGANVMIGMNVRMIVRNHAFARTDVPMRDQGFTATTCLRICDDAWIGDQVILLPHVERIGKGAIVGAGAVVTKNVPDYAIVGGNPARVIRTRALTHDPAGEAKLTLPGGPFE